jgi:glutamyl-tRNA reductase
MERIFVWGLNFKTAPIEYRERLACNKNETVYLLQALKTISGVKGDDASLYLQQG